MENGYPCGASDAAAPHVENDCKVETVCGSAAYNILVRDRLLVLECCPDAAAQMVSWACAVLPDGLTKLPVRAVYEHQRPKNIKQALLLDSSAPSGPLSADVLEQFARQLFEAFGCERLFCTDRTDFERQHAFFASVDPINLPSYPFESLEGQVFVGRRVPIEEALLVEMGITHVADLRSYANQTLGRVLEYSHFPVAVKIREHLKPTLAQVLPFLRSALQAGGKILMTFEVDHVSAEHAAASVVAFLMEDRGLGVSEALHEIQEHLWSRQLGHEMLQQLEQRCWTFGCILVEVLALSGETLCKVDVEPFASLGDIKAHLEKHTQIRPFKQRLLLGEGEMDDDRWKGVVRDFHAASPDQKYQVTLHLVQSQGDIWDALQDLVETLVQRFDRGDNLGMVLEKFEEVRERMRDRRALESFMAMPGMFGGISIAWEDGEVLKVTTSSRMNEDWEEIFIVTPDGFQQLEQ